MQLKVAIFRREQVLATQLAKGVAILMADGVDHRLVLMPCPGETVTIGDRDKANAVCFLGELIDRVSQVGIAGRRKQGPMKGDVEVKDTAQVLRVHRSAVALVQFAELVKP